MNSLLINEQVCDALKDADKRYSNRFTDCRPIIAAAQRAVVASTAPADDDDDAVDSNDKPLANALCLLYVEAARRDFTAETLRRVLLDQLNLSAPLGAALTDNFGEWKDLYVECVRRLAPPGPPIINDVTWALHLPWRSSQRLSAEKAEFTFRLSTDATEGDGVEFVCSSNAIQDMLGKTREALKSIEKCAAAI